MTTFDSPKNYHSSNPIKGNAEAKAGKSTSSSTSSTLFKNYSKQGPVITKRKN